MSEINATNIDLEDTTLSALNQLREAFGGAWWANQYATNGAIVLLTELASEELRLLTSFSEDHASWLVAHTFGVTETPRSLGQLLHLTLNDSVPSLGNPGGVFRLRMSALTITQDWALRMALSRYHRLRQQNPAITLRDVGFPVVENMTAD